MKKLFIFCGLILAVFFAKAQTYLLNEDFENGIPATWSNIDNDNDGFGWTILTADEDGIEPHSGNQCATSASYDNEEEEALTPDNYLVTPPLAIPATLTGANGLRLTWWVAAQDADYPADYYEVRVSTSGNTPADFTSPAIYGEVLSNDRWQQHSVELGNFAGNTIYIAFVHTNCEDEYMMKLDDISVFYFEDPGIVSTPATVDFGTVATSSTSAATQLTVVSALLSGNITATCSAPFEISINNTSFGTTQTLPSNTSAALFVRYSPTEVGTDTGAITLTCGEASTTISLNGTAVSCDQVLQLPFYENFESEISPCWANLDVDNDGKTWLWMHDGEGHESNGYYISYSYDELIWEDIMPNDWLITPKIAIPATGAHMSWWAAAYTEDWPDNSYEVKVSTNGNDFTTIYAETMTSETFAQRFADLSAYAGQEVNIAFVHNTNTNQTEDSYAVVIDDIAIEEGVNIEEAEMTANFRVFPNPASDMLNIEAQGFTQCQLVNTLGQVVLNENLIDGTIQLNLSNLAKGIYYVRLIGEQVKTIKVVRE